jgi:hypothetical protein
MGGAPTYPLLSSDVAPTDFSYLAKAEQANMNVTTAKQVSAHGTPARRLCFAWTGPAGQASLPVTIYMWEESSSTWFKVGPITALNGVLSYADIPALMDYNPTPSNPTRQGPGALELAIVADSTGAAAGDYTFVAGVDLSGPAA